MMKCRLINNKLFDRKDSDTNEYIIECAALSFHKSIIGITELRAWKN